MSSWICCCVKGDQDGKREQVPAEDYLLPGGEWDPSISTSPSRSSSRSSKYSTNSSRSSNSSRNRFTSFLARIRSRRLQQSRQEPDGEAEGGDYQPPPLLPSRTLPTYEDFRLLKTVGRGAFGKVMLAVHEETRILYALKVVPKAKVTTQKQMDQILAESKILKSIRHPFCVALQYAFQNDDFLFYVFEFAAGGMLFYHLAKEGKFSEPRARFYFGEIVLALDYLHSFGIIFRDLKPENCMLSELGHIVLTDFGSAKMLEVSQKTSTIAGTPQYIAPEVLRGEPYSFSADWWSCGVLLYEMLTGKPPFHSGDRVELYKLVLRGYFTVPKSVSPRARSLMYRLINKDQNLRMGCTCGSCQFHSASDIKQHSFFSQTPMDSDEEGRYAIEEAEREWEREALESQRRSRSSSFFNTAGNLFRTVSVSARRMTITGSPYLGVPCEWKWEELEGRRVTPPFKPKLTGPTDLRHFDPTLTCIPPTLNDLVTTERSLHVEDFDYVAPESEGEKNLKNSPDSLFKDECVRPISTVEVLGNSELELENSTDEEKAIVWNKVGSAPRVGGVDSAELGVGSLEEEGKFLGFSENIVEAELNQS